MKIKGREIAWYAIILMVFFAVIGLAFYLGVEHEISVQKDACQCWDGVNNICLPVTSCE